ncbi:hypothetical protein EPAKOI_003903 [Cupriavidus sp. H18C2]
MWSNAPDFARRAPCIVTFWAGSDAAGERTIFNLTVWLYLSV